MQTRRTHSAIFLVMVYAISMLFTSAPLYAAGVISVKKVCLNKEHKAYDTVDVADFGSKITTPPKGEQLPTPAPIEVSVCVSADAVVASNADIKPLFQIARSDLGIRGPAIYSSPTLDNLISPPRHS